LRIYIENITLLINTVKRSIPADAVNTEKEDLAKQSRSKNSWFPCKK